MNRVIIIITTFLVMMMNANALTMQSGQNNNYLDYTDSDKGNSFFEIISSSTNEPISNVGNGTDTFYDKRFEFDSISEDFYIIIDNYQGNTTYDISYTGDLTQDPTMYTKRTTLIEEGRYYFKFSPTGTSEQAVIWVDVPWNGSTSPQIFGVYYQEEKPKGFNDLIDGFIEGFDTIIDYNLQLWAVLFYTLIFVIVVGFVFLLFGIGFTIFAYAQKVKRKKPMNLFEDTDDFEGRPHKKRRD